MHVKLKLLIYAFRVEPYLRLLSIFAIASTSYLFWFHCLAHLLSTGTLLQARILQ